MIKILFTLVLSAQAGWLWQICQRHLVAQDPQQFEGWPVEYVLTDFERLEIKRRWNTLSEDDRETHEILRRELKSRIPYVTPDVENRIKKALALE